MLCNDMGLSMTAAFTIFAKTVTREKRIPFEVSADPFYSESNLKHLQRVAAELNAGKSARLLKIKLDLSLDYFLDFTKKMARIFSRPGPISID